MDLGYGVVWLTGWIGLAIVMSALWLIQWRRTDAGVVDVGWAGGLGLLAIWFAIAGDGEFPHRVLAGALGGFWGLRLAIYLLFNRVIGKEEDGRYQTLRASWGDRANSRFFWFFQAQALLAALLAIPFLFAGFNQRPTLHWLEWSALCLWGLAIIGEAAADWQLARFRSDPQNRGKTCRVGLWRYSRHPNYFFEWLIWCAYALLALPAPYGWAAMLCPAIMLLLILKVTGIPPTELRALASRGDDYREYQRTTSAFFPWFPKKEDAGCGS
jgi:steroid 5-alpha reductase family enzyme